MQFIPVDADVPRSIIRVKQPCRMSWLGDKPLNVGEYAVRGDIRSGLRSIAERRKIRAGFYTVTYIPGATSKAVEQPPVRVVTQAHNKPAATHVSRVEREEAAVVETVTAAATESEMTTRVAGASADDKEHVARVQAENPDPTDDLTKLPRVTEAVQEQLRVAGFMTYLQIAEASTESLAALKGLATKSAQNIIKAARNQAGLPPLEDVEPAAEPAAPSAGASAEETPLSEATIAEDGVTETDDEELDAAVQDAGEPGDDTDEGGETLA